MKKVIALSALFILATAALSSCKKDYTCTFSDAQGGAVSYPDLTSAQATTAESGCTLAGGTWSTK
jgi:hypothetical protein